MLLEPYTCIDHTWGLCPLYDVGGYIRCCASVFALVAFPL